MTKHFKRFDQQDEFYIIKTTVDATDGSLQPVTSPAPLYLLDDYAKVSIKEFQDSICSFSSMKRSITFRILNCLIYS